MPRYLVFGFCVDSEVPLDGVSPAADDTPADVRILVKHDAPAVPEADPGILMGAEGRAPCFVEWFRHAHGDRLEHVCAGRYWMECDGTAEPAVARKPVQVVVAPHPHAPAATIGSTLRMDILGRVLPLLLHRRGLICLHASAVEVHGAAVAMVAAKGTGKSTLAVALIAAGGVAVADDAVAIALGNDVASPGALVLPGVRSARVRPDTQAMHDALSWQPEDHFDGKFRLPSDQAASAEPLPLGAIYLLAAAPADAEQAAVRERLSGQQALVALLEHGKLGALMAGTAAAQEFTRLAKLVRAVPVYRLMIARDLTRLPEAVRHMTSWHGAQTLHPQ